MTRFLLRATTSVALLASAGLLVAAAAERWWPACPRGGFAAPACVERQDHLYDHLLPAEPWVPLGDAAQHAGAAVLVLAVAALLLPFALGRSPRVQVPVAIAAGASLAAVGAGTWASGDAGRVVDQPWTGPALFVWSVVLPALLVLWAARATGGGTNARRVRWALAITLVASTPAPAVLLGPLLVMYSSHDTSPWSDAAAAVPLVVAAALLWVVEPGPNRFRERDPLRRGDLPTYRDEGVPSSAGPTAGAAAA